MDNFLNYNEYDNNDFNDREEDYIFNYIKQIRSFIDNYGYDKKITTIKDDSTIIEIEDSIRVFLIENANAWNHLEIFGELKGYPDRTIYACCYEPYGEELICVENINNELFFFDTSNYKYGVKKNDIDYINDFENIF